MIAMDDTISAVVESGYRFNDDGQYYSQTNEEEDIYDKNADLIVDSVK